MKNLGERSFCILFLSFVITTMINAMAEQHENL